MAQLWRQPRQRQPVNCHWINILQQQRIRAAGRHIFGNVQQNRHSPQAAHNAAQPQRIANGLAQTVFFGNIEINARRRFIAAHLQHGDNNIGVLQGGAPVKRRCKCRMRGGGFGNALSHNLRCRQSRRVNIMQRDMGVFQPRLQQNISHNVFHKHCAAGSDYRYFDHFTRPAPLAVFDRLRLVRPIAGRQNECRFWTSGQSALGRGRRRWSARRHSRRHRAGCRRLQQGTAPLRSPAWR